MDWRARGYIWGNQRAVTRASETDPLDLVNLPQFDTPRPFRVDVLGPANSLTNVEFTAIMGRGDGFAESRVLTWNRATGRGSHLVVATSLRVNVRHLTPLVPIALGVEAAAWVTPCDDSGISASRPRAFGTPAVSASFAQNVAAQTLAAAGELRRRTVVNYQGPVSAAGTATLHIAFGRAATLLDFDLLVPPNGMWIEEANEEYMSGIWDAAGAGFARVSTWQE